MSYPLHVWFACLESGKHHGKEAAIYILKVNPLSEGGPPRMLYSLLQGSKGMRFLLSTLSLHDISVHFAGQQCWQAQPTFSRAEWAQMASEQERALLCEFQCLCRVGARRQSKLQSELSCQHTLRLQGCKTAHTKAIRFEQKECRTWGQKNWVLIVSVSLTNWKIFGKSVPFFMPHFSHLSNDGKKFTLFLQDERIKE